MEKKIKAIIDWVPHSKGGRSTIPFGAKYGPIIKVKGDIEQPNDSWSVVIVNEQFLLEFKTVAQISFLVREGMRELEKNTEFELYEGNRMVAVGKIV